MSFNNNCANRLVNLTILLSHMKENGFKKIFQGTENFVCTVKGLGESIMPLEPMLQFVLLFLK